MQGLEDLLLFGKVEFHHGGDVVGDASGRIVIDDPEHDVRCDLRGVVGVVVEIVPDLAHEGEGVLLILLCVTLLRDPCDVGIEERAVVAVLQLRPLLALDDDAEVVGVRHRDDLADVGDDAGFIQLSEGGVFRLGRLLGQQEDLLTIFHRRMDGIDGLLPCDIEMEHHFREHDESAQSDDGDGIDVAIGIIHSVVHHLFVEIVKKAELSPFRSSPACSLN